MIPTRITDSDMIVLHSIESYLASRNIPQNLPPAEKLMQYEQARDYLYSDIVQRVPRISAYILSADLETDTVAQGLNMSLSKHVMDPIFVNILLQYLYKRNSPEENNVTGAYLAKVLSKSLEQNSKEAEKTLPVKKADKDKKEDKPVEEKKDNKNDMSSVKHIWDAVNQLLGNLRAIVSTKFAELNEYQSLSIAACLAMNNKDTIIEIYKSDLPISAEIFDIFREPETISTLVKSALLLDKASVVKRTPNQQRFLDSLTTWVYKKLNDIPTMSSYPFLVAVYGTANPKVETLYINPKDCGTAYSNLYTVAKQLIN